MSPAVPAMGGMMGVLLLAAVAAWLLGRRLRRKEEGLLARISEGSARSRKQSRAGAFSEVEIELGALSQLDAESLRSEIASAKETMLAEGVRIGRAASSSNLKEEEAAPATGGLLVGTRRFAAEAREMVMGQPEFAALGLDYFMRVPSYVQPPSLDNGIRAIEAEVAAHGDIVMRECLQYVLHEAAGSSPLLFPNAPYPRDCDADGLRPDRRTPSGEPMRFADFVASPEAARANLGPPHILALRLYTTAAFTDINAPLRKLSAEGNCCAEPHPFPNVVRFLRDAIKQLRTNHAPDRTAAGGGGALSRQPTAAGLARQPTMGRLVATGGARDVQFLYRGFKDVRPGDEFLRIGGAELAPMSTTTSVEVALRYAASSSPTLLRLRISNFMQRGADVAFCSAFPAESEVLYPPQTFILPEEQREVEGILVVDAHVTVG